VQVHADVAPVQFIGSGPTINDAADNAIARAATLLVISQAEVRNRCTISGNVEIARLPGVVQLTMLAPSTFSTVPVSVTWRAGNTVSNPPAEDAGQRARRAGLSSPWRLPIVMNRGASPS